jgi:hypothetical protein
MSEKIYGLEYGRYLSSKPFAPVYNSLISTAEPMNPHWAQTLPFRLALHGHRPRHDLLKTCFRVQREQLGLVLGMFGRPNNIPLPT